MTVTKNVRNCEAAKQAMPRAEEQKLIARAQRGQPEAFREIVEAYKQRLFAFVWRTVRNHHEAEDICQTAFVKAYEALHSYSPEYAFSTWLFTIAHRLCLNHVRKRKPLTGETDFSRLGGIDDDTQEAVANTEEARRIQRLIWDAVENLTPAQRSSVLLFYREAKSCEDIGRVLNIPAVTVKSHLHRARATLRRVLGAELVEDWQDLRFRGESYSA